MTDMTSDDNFEQDFEAGKDVTPQLDDDAAARPALEIKRVNVDFPMWMVHALDREARKRGITRQSLIKSWLARRIEFEQKR